MPGSRVVETRSSSGWGAGESPGALKLRGLMSVALVAVIEEAAGGKKGRPKRAAGLICGEEADTARARREVGLGLAGALRRAWGGGGAGMETGVERFCLQLMREAGRDALREVQPEEVGSIHEWLQSIKIVWGGERDGEGWRVHGGGGSGARQRGGVYYTPVRLAERLVRDEVDAAVTRAERAVTGTRGSKAARRARAVLSVRVVDPSAGCGAFLLATGRRLADELARARGWSRGGVVSAEQRRRAWREVASRCLMGAEIDAVAAECCRAALWIEGGGGTGLARALEKNIRVGDALLGAPVRGAWGRALARIEGRRGADAWCAAAWGGREKKPARWFHWREEFAAVFGGGAGGRAGAGFDLVVGNPPFLNQLETATAVSRGAAGLMAARFGGVVRGYADVSAAFVMLAAELLKPGGVAVMIQPQSLLGAKHAGPIRLALEREARLRGLWLGEGDEFGGASVRACAVTLERRVDGETRAREVCVVSRGVGEGRAELATGAAGEWAGLAARAGGVPTVAYRGAGVVGSVAAVTADFRDEYYGLQGKLVEHDSLTEKQRADWRGYPRLMTSGLIELARSRWGEVGTRMHRTKWIAPRVDAEKLSADGKMARWLAARRVAKLMMATQTRVIEVVTDERGEAVASTPVISIVPGGAGGTGGAGEIWKIGAAVASPVATMVAAGWSAGTALASGAIKLSAGQVRALPLPGADARAWAVAGRWFELACGAGDERTRRAALMEMGRAMNEAYGVPTRARAGLMAWWAERLEGADGRLGEKRG
jgi:hypothetical protein